VCSYQNCKGKFKSKEEFFKHVLEHFQPVRPYYVCPYDESCNKKYIILNTLKEHIDIHHLKKLDNHKCDGCGKHFQTATGLYYHKNKYHYCKLENNIKETQIAIKFENQTDN